MVTLEIILSFVLFLIVTPSVISLTTDIQNLSLESLQYYQAQLLSEQALNKARAMSRSEFEQLNSYTQQSGIYSTSINIETLNAFTVKVRVETTWRNSKLQSKATFMEAVLTDWKSAIDAEACLLTGNWQGMESIDSVSTGSDNPPTDLAVRGKYAYVTTNSNTTSRSDLIIYDLSNPLAVNKISELNTGPGLSSIRLVGNYAFVGNTSINAQLQIINVTDPRQPIITSNYKLPGNYSDNTTIANQLAYADSKVFLGTQKSQITELHIIDVSNPLQPFEIGNYELNTAVNDLMVNDKKIYVASPDAEELKILDFTNISSITYIGGFNAPGGSGNGKSLDRIRNTIYLGRTLGGKEFYIADTKDPANVKILSNVDTNVSINDVVTTGRVAFLGTLHGTKEVEAWNVVNPKLPQLLSTINLFGTPQAMACGSEYLYIAAELNNTLITIKQVP